MERTLTMPPHKPEALHQFGCPRGWRGRLIGHLMALKNGAMNRAALDQLDPQPGERVLEVGFGPGRTLGRVARLTGPGIAPGGFVAGIDHSMAMVRQASWRNRRLIAAGQAELRHASVADIPYPDGHFDKAFAVNAFQFWPQPLAGLRELHRVLRPGGKLVLTLRAAAQPLRWDLSCAARGAERVESARQAMQAAGFDEITLTQRPVGRLLAVCVIGVKPGAGDEPPSGSEQ